MHYSCRGRGNETGHTRCSSFKGQQQRSIKKYLKRFRFSGFCNTISDNMDHLKPFQVSMASHIPKWILI
ncbi:Centromere Protein P [Manis pentadactyla]|nr:Centromere Protein P [Manis pentadactyla]